MQTAATTLTTQEHLVMNWDSNTIMTSSNYCVILFFAEIKDTSKTGRRVFNIYGQGSMISSNQPVIPTLLSSQHIDFNYTDVLSYNLSLEATPSSTLPPLLNAIELYIIAPVRAARTSDKDFAAIYGIKEYYKIFKDWNGDPCNPYRWEAVTCSPDSNNINILRISSMNLRNYGLKGSLSDHFGDLTALTDLRLEYNDLYGSIPSSLSQLADLGNLDLSYNRFSGSIPKSLDYASLAFLDITKTNISTVLPPGLQRKRRDGSLQFRYGDTNPTPSPSHKKNSIIAISVVVPLMVIAVATVTAFWLKRKKHIRFIASQPNESYDPNRQFSYNDIKRITNNFENNIGTGGYGTVYFGLLEDGVQVAVKVRSHSSKQGIKEFSAEARNLTRVHHKSLVSLMGYCVDKNCMAIVYEYMQEGNLQDKLKDDEMPLSWIQRLRIVYESALGLEYLHQACNPPLIHRDVKTSNILLNSNLEAKVADFGLSRAFNNEASCRVLTTVVGTIGYLDPEYYMTNQLSAKSDVFSFGIVLLEIITGRAPIIPGEGANLEEWVHQKVSEGDIQSIVDPKMQRKYDINSVWKVTNLACKCTEHNSSERPTMTEVVSELKDSLNLEISEAELHTGGTDKYVTDVSHDSDEVAFIGAMSVSGHVVR
ncbi:hypothetical protein LUZ61_009264 [Rhynchospora tenuis]|uniref:non-specific serine/threonine protein kinase n=1 Tax=Rhynchospora tenuis TaxID=198213 RepID=A0AAD5ZWW0_9POAL|nr:hypothetical protein LUZ61_009264 [Rhynchospora tenuis]